MLLGLSELLCTKGFDEHLVHANICDCHCSFHCQSLEKFLSIFSWPDQPLGKGWTLSSFRTSLFKRCLALNNLLPFFSYLAFFARGTTYFWQP